MVNFIIPGTMKSGTSALVKYLSEHPDIHIPNNEVRFFSQYYNRGTDWYVNRLQGNRTGGAHIIGDKTVNYAYLPYVPERIKRHYPNVKLIWMFREPVDRLLSHYRHFYSFGKENKPFMEAIETGEKRKKEKHMEGIDYLEVSTYSVQLKRYLRYFTIENMHFVVSEIFKEKPESDLAQICRFLEVDESFAFNSPALSPEVNKTETRPMSPGLQHFSWRYVRPNWPKIHRIVLAKNVTEGPVVIEISPRTRSELRDFFRPYVYELGNITGLNLAIWGYDDN